ncbi:hypothetical protein Ddye_024810, partial [Dipteronia dyeriana]
LAVMSRMGHHRLLQLENDFEEGSLGTLSVLMIDLEREVQEYTMMILKGLCRVQEKGYVHCNLKPANILVVPLQDGTNYLKIADFELEKEPREGVIWEFFQVQVSQDTALHVN